ncbi:TIGR03943 family putative permease subunit [Cryptosporangium arvum]|uniref:TIGR03943 family protein n=1 Tax=Cryptosporangium arvum DSM 44712 TaxID=927661 RepID=A0A010YFQ8_9ACTN|nr:TIGR03943 family protein [Cryptosporangium arvum]EXG79065.1 TIGR03943 family protein [Cryptosporangium arvum DSM 44712]
MRREVQAVVFILLGAVLLKLVISGEYLNYVQSLLKFPLVATGVVLIAFGVLGFARDWRGRGALERSRERAADARVRTHGPGAQPDDEHEPDVDEHAHDHVGDGHGVGWLWILPVFVLVLVPPPALGSFAAERGAATVPKPPKSVEFAALKGSNPVPLEVHDYAQRAVWDNGRTLTGRTIELSGFMTPHSGGSWYLTRMKVNCCAADARPYQVEIVDSPVPAVRDEWVKVTGTWVPSTAKDPFDAVALLKATTVNGIPTPAQPYE